MELEELRRQLVAGTLEPYQLPVAPPPRLYKLKRVTAPYCYNHDPITPDLHKKRFKVVCDGTVVSFPVDLDTGRLVASAYTGQHFIIIKYKCPKETITASVLMVWPCWKPGLVEKDGTKSREPTPANETCYYIEAQVREIEVFKVRFKVLQDCTVGRGGGQLTLGKGQVIEIIEDDIAELIRDKLVRTGKVVEYGH